MQKKLLGMAVATALTPPANSLAQLQVYGTAHMSFAATKYSDAANGTPGVSKMAVNSHASNFGIRSSESLGGGLTGWVQYEFNVKMERDNDLTSGNGSSRNTAIGLRGGFGNVFFGTWETPFAQTFRMWDVGTISGYGPSTAVMYRRESTTSAPSSNCGNVAAGGGAAAAAGTPFCYHADAGPAFANGGYALWRRYGSAVHYESPVFSGFQFKMGYQPNESKSSIGVIENPSSWSASGAWTGMGGKARAFLAYMSAKDWTSVGETDNGYIIGGGYDFGFVNVGAAWENYTYATGAPGAIANVGPAGVGDAEASDFAVSASIPLGSGKIGVSYARAKDIEVAGTTIDNGAKQIGIGYEWALSKRTAVSFGYAKIDNDSLAAFTWTGMAPSHNGFSPVNLAGADVSNVFVAFRHSF